MISSCISLAQLKLSLEKRLKYSINKIEPCLSDIYHDFSIGDGANATYYWDFEAENFVLGLPVNTMKNPLFYGKLHVKVLNGGVVQRANYFFRMGNYIVDGINASSLFYLYSSSAEGVLVLNYIDDGVTSNPLPGMSLQHNLTPENSANLVLSDHIRVQVFTWGGVGRVSVILNIYFEGYKIYFR